jgi:hypothetical protein
MPGVLDGVFIFLLLVSPKCNGGGLVAPNPAWREKADEGFG